MRDLMSCAICGAPWDVEPLCDDCRRGRTAYCSCGRVLELGDAGECERCHDDEHRSLLK